MSDTGGAEAALAARVAKQDHGAIADSLALVEDTRAESLPRQRALLAALAKHTPLAHVVVGLTGPPGVGKSTLSGALIRPWVASGTGVGMVAVDPSSRRSGGALLGDRARLRFEADEPVFVRSMAARDRLGGLAPATRGAVAVMRAAFPWTLVETVGVGQSEIDVQTVADSVVLVLQPGSGDTLQFMKAGILEIPDVMVVHKWDLGAPAERTMADLEAMLERAPSPPGDGWKPPLIGASAQDGTGVTELADALASHAAHLERSGERGARRAAQREAWALELFERRYGTRGLDALGGRGRAIVRVRETPGTALDAYDALEAQADL